MNGNNRVSSYQNMSGVDRVATLLLALPDDRANDLLGRFSFDEIQQISYAMIKLEKISPAIVEQVLYEFMRTMYTVPPLKGSWERAEKLLAKVLPEEKISLLRSRTQGEQTLWQDIPELPVSFFTEYLKKESNQTIALILKNIPNPNYVVKILSEFPQDMSVDIVYRMVNLPEIDHSVLRHLEQSLLAIVTATGKPDRYAEMAELIDAMPPTQGNLLMEGLSNLHAPTVSRIRPFMFSFDEIARLDDNAIQLLLKSFNKTRLAVALKGVRPEILSRFMQNMSVRAGKLLQDEVNILTNLSMEEIEQAQVELAQAAKQLIRSGAIKRASLATTETHEENTKPESPDSAQEGGQA